MKSIVIDGRELTANEAHVLQRALQTYQRLHLGQVSKVIEPLVEHIEANDVKFACAPYKGSTDYVPEITRINVLLEELDATITGMRSGGPSIGSKKVSNDARIARRLEACITGDPIVLSLYNEDGSPSR